MEKDTEFYDKVDGKKIIGKVVKGTKIQGVTGEVHTVPLKIQTENGREVYLLTYPSLPTEKPVGPKKQKTSET